MITIAMGMVMASRKKTEKKKNKFRVLREDEEEYDYLD